MSSRSLELAQAYRHTRYRVWLADNTQLDLYPDQRNQAMDNLLQQHAAQQGHVISACNPASQICSMPANQRATKALHRRITQEGWPCFAAQGQALAGDWPAEDSCLIVGSSRAQAIALAHDFGQYAVLEHSLGDCSAVIFTELFKQTHNQSRE